MDAKRIKELQKSHTESLKVMKKFVGRAAAMEKLLVDLIKETNKRIFELGERVDKLGRACAEAFNQTKQVVSKLAEIQEDTRLDLSEYGGTIIDSTWN